MKNESMVINGITYLVTLFPLVAIGHELDHYRKVEVCLPDGTRYLGVFFLDPKEGQSGKGEVFWDDPRIIIVQSLSEKSVRDAVQYVLESGSLHAAMEQAAP